MTVSTETVMVLIQEEEASTMTDISRRMIFPTAFGALAALYAAPGLANADGEGTAQERAAIKLVNDLIAAIATKDPNQALPLVWDDFVFKGVPSSPERKGKQEFLADTQKFLSMPLASRLIFAKKITRAYAMGGPTGTAVLAFREDYIDIDGKKTTIPLAASVWVVGDKIKAWYDFPLVEDPDSKNWGMETSKAAPAGK